MEKDSIWVWVEHWEGVERVVVHELLGKARDLADKSARPLVALVAGSKAAEAAQRIQGSPDVIMVLETQGAAQPEALPYIQALERLCREWSPFVLMAPCTFRSMQWMPGLAVSLSVSMVSEVTGLELQEGGRLLVRRPIHGGRFLVELESSGPPPYLLAVRPRAFSRREANRCAKIERISVEELTGPVELLGAVQESDSGPELTEAAVVVAGGRGMGGPESFAMLEELAQLLGGAVGASRSVVDSGWRPASQQVGKSGKTVSPDLYMAFGISGAIHHIMGMDSSRVVVAVNRDPNALIFQHADYAVVEDLHELLPALISELKKEA
ncbi:MAG: electron transfer flavoprotein subunit alpha/FixB family protein [bacterium]